MRNGFAVALLGLVLFIVGCGKPPAAEEQEVKPVVQVAVDVARRQSVRETIPVTGTLSPLSDRESKVAPLAAGRIAKVFVKMGDVVSKGQVLALLETGALIGQAQQAEATARSDEESYKQAKLNYQLQVTSQRSSIIQAEQNLSSQQVALSKLLAGARPQEVAQAQATLVSAEAALTNAQQNMSRSQTLFAEGLLARKDLEAAQAQERTAAAQVQGAKEALSLTKAGNRPQDIDAQRIAVRQAEEGLRSARNASVQNSVKAQDVQIALRQLESAKGALAAVRSQLQAQTIRAPLGGVVVGRTVNAGEAVDTTGSIATIADLSQVRILLNVPAAQVGQIQVGQILEFSTEGAATRLRRALISVVGKAVDPATNTVAVEALAQNADRQLRDDGFVKGQIVIGVHNSATVVPSEAVVDKDGKATVFVVDKDSVAHAKTVERGLHEAGIQEVSGIMPGDRVVTKGAFELEDGAKVKLEGGEGSDSKESGKGATQSE